MQCNGSEETDLMALFLNLLIGGSSYHHWDWGWDSHPSFPNPPSHPLQFPPIHPLDLKQFKLPVHQERLSQNFPPPIYIIFIHYFLQSHFPICFGIHFVLPSDVFRCPSPCFLDDGLSALLEGRIHSIREVICSLLNAEHGPQYLAHCLQWFNIY